MASPATPEWLKEIASILKRAGKVPSGHTGNVDLSLYLLQGGVNGATVKVSEQIK